MAYTPKRGDVIWINFNPQAGSEQAGRRPVVVLSPKSYKHKVGLVVICPITNQAKGYPFEVLLPEKVDVTGVILSDQVKSMDWRIRNAEFKESLPEDIISEVLAKFGTLLG